VTGPSARRQTRKQKVSFKGSVRAGQVPHTAVLERGEQLGEAPAAGEKEGLFNAAPYYAPHEI